MQGGNLCRKLTEMSRVLLVIPLLFVAYFSNAQFTTGNLAVFRAESASANNTNFSIIELSPTAATQALPVTTVAINGTTGGNALRTSGSASSTGYLSNSNDGSLLCFAAHNSTTTSGNANAILPRGVGTLNAAAAFTLATTYTGTSGSQTRSATSIDNSSWYIADQGGLYTNSATSASPTGNFRSVKAFGGTAYIFQASTSAASVSTVSAPSGATITGLPGLPNGTSNNQDFYMISSGSNGNTYDVLYILTASSATAGTILKYSLNGGSWVSNGSYTTTFGGFGLAAAKNGSSVSLYVTTGTGATAANSVLLLSDNAGYNSPINITTANNVTLYTTSATTVLKGIAFAPVVTAAPNVIPVASSLNFGSVLSGASSTAQTVTLTGSNLTPATGTLTITTPGSNFQVSSDGGISWGSTTTVNYSGNGATIGSFQVRFLPSSSGTFSGLVTISGGGLATAENVAVYGTGSNSLSLAFSASTSTFLNPPYVTGTINDAGDPAQQSGIVVDVQENSVAIPVASYTLTAASSNTTVVPVANINIVTVDGQATVKITPAAVGYSTITLTLTKGADTKTLDINYAASSASTTYPVTYWPAGISDASAAIALDDDYMVIGDDETNLLYVFDRKHSGLPVTTWDFNQGNLLALTDGTTGNWKELDIEAGVTSPATTGKMYFMGSMSNSSSFNLKPNRDRIIAVTVSGTGSATTFANAGYVSGLRAQLVTWGDANGYNFTASAADGKDPKTIDGFNIEGMVFGPDNTTMYIGFRAPLVPTANRTKALIAPIQNFETWFNNGAPTGNATIGSPIELDLGGRGIRDIIRLSNGTYVIIAGSYDGTQVAAAYRWTGNASDAPSLISGLDISGLNAEAAMQINSGGSIALDRLQVISDNGGVAFYGDGIEAKDLTTNNWKKFSNAIVVAASNVLPVTFEYFTAVKKASSAVLSWKMDEPQGVDHFDIMRSANGTDFTTVGTVPAYSMQTLYSFTDNNTAGNSKWYYRIKTIENSSQVSLTAIRIVDFGSSLPLVMMYPNPVVGNNNFTLVINKTGVKNVQVYSSNGVLFKRYVFADQVKDLSTTGWSKGYYIVRIKTEDGTVTTEKLVVQ